MKTSICIIISFVSTGLFSQNYWLPSGTMSKGNSDWVYCMTANSSGHLFASSWAVGIYKSENGTQWNFSGLDGKRVSFLTVAPNGDIYALSKTTSFQYIHCSTDNGNSWINVFEGSYPLNYAGGGDVVFPSDGSIISAFAVTVGPTIGDVATFIFKSTDEGRHWFQIQRFDVGFVGGMEITADGKILIGTSTSGVLYSTNNGITFSNLNSFPPIFVKTIVKAPDNTIYVSDAFGLHRSTDNGNTFVDVGSQNSTAYLGSACCNSNGDVFISMDDKKVFLSTDCGSNWKQINSGIPAASYIYSFTSSNGIVYAGTNNAGAFYFSPVTGVLNSNQPEAGFDLYQNYPNPFNPETVINYHLAKSGFVTINVYDILGKNIATLVNEERPAGVHSVTWNATDYPGGTYFCKLVSNSKNGEFISDTKRMTMVK